ncbi:MAG: hypothetical protein IT371_11935 [Deltaproteobacteria bacterium]|nr:hypothetical protein [Deltaproteobacteria bacterium]
MRHRGSFVVWAALLGALGTPSAAVAADRVPWQTRAAARLEKATAVPILGRIVLPLAARLSVAGLRAADPAVNEAYRTRSRNVVRAVKDLENPFGYYGMIHAINVGFAGAALFGMALLRPLLELAPVQNVAYWAAPFVVGGGLAALLERHVRGIGEKAGNAAALKKAGQLPQLAAARTQATDLVRRARLLLND